MKVGLAVASIPVVLYVAACVLLYSRQRVLLYYPTPESPGHGAELLRLESAGETINVRCVNPGKPAAILYFGGNGEDVALNIPDFRQAFPEQTIYFVHYRGYGGSSGSPSEQGLFRDALNVHDLVRANHDRISAIGRSLGSGVAVYLATHRDFRKLVLVTPYDSIEALARKSVPFLPVRLLLRDKYRSVDLAPGIETPTLVVIAERDEVIPRDSTERLIAAFPSSVVVTRVIERATHNTIGDNPEYLSQLRRFLEDSR